MKHTRSRVADAAAAGHDPADRARGVNRTAALKWRSVIGYGLGDVANNFAFSLGMLFLLNYYTDVVGLGAAAAGTLLMSVRIYDALMDIAAGRLIDRSRGSARWGRFRPYLLWGALPLLLLNVAVFSVPTSWDASSKLVYAYVTYALLGTAYAFVNIPYGSLASVMTQVSRERTRLSAARTMMSTATILVLALLLGRVLHKLQGEALQSLLTQITLALAAVGVLLYLVCFATSREVVSRGTQAPSWKDSLSTLSRNRPLLVLSLAAICIMAGNSASGAATLYYARYVLGDASLFATIIATTILCGMVVSVPLTPRLTAVIGKRATFQLGMFVAAAAKLWFYFAPPSTLSWVLALLALSSVGLMLSMASIWALEADTVEYGEWRTGLRLEGMNYAMFSLARKIGLAVGGSIPAFLLATSGYVPNLATQSPAALHAIQQALALAPALAFSAAFLIMLCYPLSDRRFLALVEEIRRR
jgi:glucuronide carrier protein